jgi:ribosome-interacting GTPase 1
LKKELSEIGIKVDQRPPDIIVEKMSSGGISINIQVPVKITENLVREILHIHGIHNGRITIREPGLTDDQLIDVLNGNRVYIPSIIVLNKIDLVNQAFVTEVQSKIGENLIPVSADRNINIDVLKESIYKRLDFIRIYMRPKNGETDYKEPLIMRSGCTIEDVCNKIHRSMLKDFRFAYLWGKSAKFDGQKVGLDHQLMDEDVLTIVKRLL